MSNWARPSYPPSKYPGCIRCQWCGAQYKRGGWVWGVHEPGSTDGRFYRGGAIPDDRCPGCNKHEDDKP